jgi:hypothetical protein
LGCRYCVSTFKENGTFGMSFSQRFNFEMCYVVIFIDRPERTSSSFVNGR